MTIGIRWSREIIPIRKRGAVWIMVGRLRKVGKRKPCGRLAQTYINPKAQVLAQPHRMAAPVKRRDWPQAESNFGRMVLRESVTAAQYEAGIRFTELCVAFCAVYDTPSPHPHAIDLTRVGVSRVREMPSEKAAAIKRAYNSAFEVCMEAGRPALRAVKDHVVLDRPVGDFDTLHLLRAGLNQLVHHFGIHPELELDRKPQIISRA